jgi:glycyl-tRNA synthetase beta chain
MTACALALADKLETIAGMFGVGQEPSGDKDPFALRRHALGVVRILIEKQSESSLRSLVDLAIGEMPQNAKSDWAVILDFLLERAKSYFLEKGYSAKAIESVLRPMGGETPLHVLLGCIDGASRFIATEEGKILAEANKRITNILKKSGFEVPTGFAPDALTRKPDPGLFQEKAEIDFWNALQQIGGESVELRRQLRFGESLSALSRLALPTKVFFDNVMVNVEDPAIRDNRITLLQHARAYMNQVADLSLMAA